MVLLPASIQEVRKGGEKKKFDFPALEENKDYYAIIYEYILIDMESSPTDEEMQYGVDFLWRIGFCFAPALKKVNWISGILFDMSDLICLWDPDWDPTWYGCYQLEDWFW